ncbi:Transmembrane protein 234-like, partial [Lachnellula cervina]
PSQSPHNGRRRAHPIPPIFNYILGFLLIGIAWGFTTPFIRAAARTHKPPAHPILDSPAVKSSWFKSRVYGAFFGVVDLLRNPRYAVPLVINLTGSVWFFLLIGQAGEFCFSFFCVFGDLRWGSLRELSLTVPITNSLAFLFTVLGDWYVDRKVISRDTWIGMTLSLVGIGLCVQSKNK